MKSEFGVVGLGTMGANLALNLDDHDVSVAAWDISAEAVQRFLSEHPERGFVGATGLADLVGSLERPRRILLMIPAGKPVEQTIEALEPHLDEGDILLDGGNSHFADTERRGRRLAERGIRFFGVGVSGGSEGARHGPSMMPGGPREAYEEIRPVLEAIAARTPAGPCVAYLGSGGAGHFVKMVHNGIEYADMQGIAEAYDFLSRGLGYDARRLAGTFGAWNEGELESFLLEITAEIFRVTDERTGEPLVERVLDMAEQKGTGRWTATTALELGAPVPSIMAAVDARVLSSRRQERLAASRRLAGPAFALPGDELEDLAEDARRALYASRICAFAQGMDLIRQGSTEHGWGIAAGEVARVWMGGCIIRARLLEPIREALQRDPDLPNLLLDEHLGRAVEQAQDGWRRAVASAARIGLPVPCWSAALAYFDAFRTERLPQNLTQAQRDWFGAHTYHLLDDPDGQPIHTDWAALAAEPRA
ncbi:MAG TPA: decarboxylating NADP(+)-dependent phosphogluconate dehydrogenase [Gemmatimonadota bacterium]|nr:decarboxylating NADP(+)-dependent phosphogluconate dehydrogenase [Gemmatimonadota bacterium]